MGQAVDEVHVDAFESQFARQNDEVTRLFIWLNAVYGFLYFRLEILNAHAYTIKTHFAQRAQMRWSGNARIDFDSDFRVGCEGESFASVREQIFDLFGR
jgi:hypothetical protein